MELTARSRSIRYLSFLTFALTINIVDRALTLSVPKTGPRTLVTIAASCDLAVIVSFAYYWLPIRPGIRAYSQWRRSHYCNNERASPGAILTGAGLERYPLGRKSVF